MDSTRHKPQVSTFAGKINNPRKGEIYSNKPNKAKIRSNKRTLQKLLELGKWKRWIGIGVRHTFSRLNSRGITSLSIDQSRESREFEIEEKKGTNST